MTTMGARRKYTLFTTFVAAILIGLASSSHAFTDAPPAQIQVDRGNTIVRVYSGQATAPDPGAPSVANSLPDIAAAGTYQRVVDTSALPFAAVGKLDVVLLNGQRRQCTATVVTSTAAITSASCLKPGRDIDGAIALEIRFTPGQTQASSGAATTAPLGTRSFYYYEMPTVFYDRSDLEPDYAAIFFREPLVNPAVLVDVKLGQSPSNGTIVGYASTAAGEAGSLAQWRGDSPISSIGTRRLTYALPYDSGLSGAPLLELGSDGVYRLMGVAVEGTTGTLAATRLLSSDDTLFRRWLGLPPVEGAIQSGWWWAPGEPGRGIFLDISDGKLFLTLLGYGNDGRSTWHVAAGAMSSDTTFQGALIGYQGGAAFGATYSRPVPAEIAGDVTLTFTGSRKAQLVTPWGTKSIERYPFVVNGTAPDPAGPPYPESGIWWNPSEPGTAVAVEVQGNTMMIALLDYRSGDRPQWTFVLNDMFLPLLFTGSLVDVTGPPNTQAWRPIDGVLPSRDVIVEVKARDRIEIVLSPTGVRIPLVRFKF